MLLSKQILLIFYKLQKFTNMSTDNTYSEITWIDGEITLVGRHESKDGILEIIAEWNIATNDSTSHWRLCWQFRSPYQQFHELGTYGLPGDSIDISKGEALAKAEEILRETRYRAAHFQQQKASAVVV
jgi:hypothetical protein